METTDLVIIGSGPAGYAAGIYTARANIKTVLFEGFLAGIAGGQLMTTTVVENFPGFPDGIFGADLMGNMKKQAQKYGVKVLPEDVVSVDFSVYPFVIKGGRSELVAKSVIIATGASAKKADIPGCGDGELWQKGVSACAICDGAAPIFRNNPLYVIGGGDSALEEALFLTKYASIVYIVHRREKLKASNIMIDKVLSNPKIEILYNSEIKEVSGESKVTSVTIFNSATQTVEKKEAAGVFFAIGHKPNTDFLQNQLKLNDAGYIMVKNGTFTSVEGVFAAGDVQDFRYRQAITAAGSGCMAALDLIRWLEHRK